MTRVPWRRSPGWRVGLLAAAIIVAAVYVVATLARGSHPGGVGEEASAAEPCASAEAASLTFAPSVDRDEPGRGGPVQAEPPRLRLVEDLRLGEAPSGPHAFGLVRHVALTRQERMVVFDGGAGELRMFDVEGRHLWSVTNAESGLTYVSAMGVVRDTIVVWGRFGRQQGIAFFDLQGERLADVDTDPLVRSAGASSECRVTAIDATGETGLVLFTRREGAAGAGPGTTVRLSYDLWTFSPSGGLGRRIGAWRDPVERRIVDVTSPGPGTDGEPSDGLARSRHVVTPPMSPVPRFAFGGGRVYVSNGAELEIAVYEGGGERRGRRVLPGRPQAVTEADLAAYYADLFQTVDDSVYREALRSRIIPIMKALPHGGSVPVVRALRASEGGELAAVRADVEPSSGDGAAEIPVDILESDGTVRGRVALPGTVDIVAFTGERLYGLVRSAAGSGPAAGDATPEGWAGRVTLVRFTIMN